MIKFKLLVFLLSFSFFISLCVSTKVIIIKDDEDESSELGFAGSKRSSEMLIEDESRKKGPRPSYILSLCGHRLDPVAINNHFLSSSSEIKTYACNSCPKMFSYESFVMDLIKKDHVPEGISYIDSRLDSLQIQNLAKFAIKDPTGRTLLNLLKMEVPIHKHPILEKLPISLYAARFSSPEVVHILLNSGLEFEPAQEHHLYYLFLLSVVKLNFAVAEYLWTSNREYFEKICNCNGTIGTILEHRWGSNAKYSFYPEKYMESIDWLVKKGFSINLSHSCTKSVAKRPILHTAIYYNDTRAINYFIKNGANLNILDEKRMDPLFFAIYYGKLEALRLLYDLINAGNAQYLTSGLNALHCAILNGHIATVKFLISKGFSFMTRNKSIYFLLHRVTLLKNAPLIEMLLENGANPYEVAETNTYDNFIANNPVYASRFSRNDPAIVLAIINDQFDIVEKFLDNGVSPNTRIAEGGSSLLHLACQLNHVETTKLLISRNADTLAIDNCGCVAFSYVSQDWLAQIPNYHRYNLEI